MVFKLDILGACLSGADLKSLRYPLWNSNPLLLREKIPVLSSLQTVVLCAGCGVNGEIVFQPLLPAYRWAFSPCLYVEAQPGFIFFFRESCSTCSCRFCLWEKVSLGPSYVTILNQNWDHLSAIHYCVFTDLNHPYMMGLFCSH